MKSSTKKKAAKATIGHTVTDEGNKGDKATRLIGFMYFTFFVISIWLFRHALMAHDVLYRPEYNKTWSPKSLRMIMFSCLSFAVPMFIVAITGFMIILSSECGKSPRLLWTNIYLCGYVLVNIVALLCWLSHVNGYLDVMSCVVGFTFCLYPIHVNWVSVQRIEGCAKKQD